MWALDKHRNLIERQPNWTGYGIGSIDMHAEAPDSDPVQGIIIDVSEPTDQRAVPEDDRIGDCLDGVPVRFEIAGPTQWYAVDPSEWHGYDDADDAWKARLVSAPTPTPEPVGGGKTPAFPVLGTDEWLQSWSATAADAFEDGPEGQLPKVEFCTRSTRATYEEAVAVMKKYGAAIERQPNYIATEIATMGYLDGGTKGTVIFVYVYDVVDQSALPEGDRIGRCIGGVPTFLDVWFDYAPNPDWAPVSLLGPGEEPLTKAPGVARAVPWFVPTPAPAPVLATAATTSEFDNEGKPRLKNDVIWSEAGMAKRWATEEWHEQIRRWEQCMGEWRITEREARSLRSRYRDLFERQPNNNNMMSAESFGDFTGAKHSDGDPVLGIVFNVSGIVHQSLLPKEIRIGDCIEGLPVHFMGWYSQLIWPPDIAYDLQVEEARRVWDKHRSLIRRYPYYTGGSAGPYYGYLTGKKTPTGKDAIGIVIAVEKITNPRTLPKEDRIGDYLDWVPVYFDIREADSTASTTNAP